MTNTEKILAEFDEKYLNKGTPTGLNQKNFKNFTALVKDIRNSFLSTAITQALAEDRERVVMEIRKRMPSHDAVMEYLSSLDKPLTDNKERK